MQAHGTIFDYDGFTVDVDDVAPNWFPPFAHVLDPMLLVCVPKRLGRAYYERLRGEHDAARRGV